MSDISREIVKCAKCGKWHIGRTTTILSEKNREKLMK